MFREAFRLYKEELEKRYKHAVEEGHELFVKDCYSVGRYDPATSDDVRYVREAVDSIKSRKVKGIFSTLESFSGFVQSDESPTVGIIVVDLNGLFTMENQGIFGMLSDAMQRSYASTPCNLRVTSIYQKHPSMFDSIGDPPITLETDGKETHITLDRDKADEHMANPPAFYLSHDPVTGNIVPVIPGRIQIQPKDDLREYFRITMNGLVGPELD